LCRADDIFEKSVKQSRFEQLHFEQLTLTHLSLLNQLAKLQFQFDSALKKVIENLGRVSEE
jgi:hypothetical protein